MPARKIKVGIIGCGTIGSFLADKIRCDYRTKAEILSLADHHAERLNILRQKIGPPCRIVKLPELVRKSDLIVEAASPQAVMELLKLRVSWKNKQLMIMSSGGLLLAGARLKTFTGKFEGKIFVPSGAIGGIDSLLAAGEARLAEVKILTRKPPKGLDQAPYFKNRNFPALSATQEKRVFRGTAREAINGFPQNVNVAALLSLAGSGPEKTRVEIWTSKKYRTNRHEITIRYAGGSMRIEMDNLPSPENPKTSALAMYAASASLKRIFSPIHYGT